MRPLKVPIVQFIILSMICISIESQAQTSDIRNQLYIGARPMGMGETFAAIADDGNAIHWNPAGLPWIDRYEFQSMYANLYHMDIQNNYISFVLPYSEKWAFGLDWLNISTDDNELAYNQNLFNLAISRKIIPGLALGLNLKHLRTGASVDDLSEGTAAGWGTDLGILFLPELFFPRLKGLKLAIVGHDFTDTKVKYENNVSEAILLRNIRYGLAYQFQNLPFIEQPLVAIDIDDRIHFGAEFWLPALLKFQLGFRLGIQKDIYPHGEEDVTTSFGTSFKYRLMERYGLNFDYAFTNSPLLPNTHRFSLGFSFALPESPVKIDTISMNDIYASFYPYHADTTCATLECRYNQKKKLDLKIKLTQSQYGIYSEREITLNPELIPEDSLKKVALVPLFSNKILEARGEEKIQAEILLEPKTLFRSKFEKEKSEFKLYGIGKINWANGENQAAAFITPDDPVVKDFARMLLKAYPDSQIIINDKITQAMLIFCGLRAEGIKYVGDENSTYRNLAIDNIYYPRELLLKKFGDCDDITVLLASLLESIGIATRLICTPDHIFLLMNSELHKKQRAKLCLEDDKMLKILDDDKIWIPIETTIIDDQGKSFWDAWNEGSAQLELSCNIIKVHEAWKKFSPLPIKALDKITRPETISMPRSFSGSTFQNDYQSIQSKRLQYLEKLNDKTKDKLINSSERVYYLKQLGDIQAMLYMSDDAILNYQKALKMDSKNASIRNNLGNVYFQKGVLDSAEINYQQALAHTATMNDSVGIFLNLGNLYAAADSIDLARHFYERVVKGPDDIGKVEASLGLTLSTINLSKARQTVSDISEITVKQLIQDVLESLEATKALQVKTTSKSIHHLKKSKKKIKDIFYWSF